MAQLITARLSRSDNTPWGFRLQGGKDFGQPLVLQKVNVGSIADKAGLLAGDALIKVNGEELFNLRHKDAQDAIVRAGSTFDLTVSRGGSTWKPSVTPLTSPVPTSAGVPLVTKTSLAAKPTASVGAIGTGHNTSAKPFATNGGPIRSIVNKQYNSPVAMYSDETIAETLSAQAEVLAGGVLGVNFKKNEKVYNADKSEVFKMLQEQGSEPEPARPSSIHQEQVTRHVMAPISIPKPPSNNGLPPGQNICADCERLIVGVFVRIKDKNLHVECFKCSTCGTSLKNQGYYNLNNKLYCDIHARLAALNSPPPNTNGMVPVAVPPKEPTSTISSALSAHASAFNGSNFAAAPAPAPLTTNCLTIDVVASPTHSRTSSTSSGYGNSTSSFSLKNSPVVQSPTHSRQSSGVSLHELNLGDHINSITNDYNKEQVSDEEKENKNGNFYYKTMTGGVIRSVKPPNKNNGLFKYKLPSTISGPKPFSTVSPKAPPASSVSAPVSAPKSPIAYPPPAAPTWSAPAPAPAPAAPIPAAVAPPKPAPQHLQGTPNVFKPSHLPTRKPESKMLLLSYIREEEGRPEVLKGYERQLHSRGTTPAFQWPPKPPSEEEVPLAAPIYVAPPETQHVQPKPRDKPLLPPSVQNSDNRQHMSAPELSQQYDERVEGYLEQPELYSHSSGSTSSSSGETSSEEYQMYSTNISQPLVKYFPDQRPELDYQPVLDHPSNYSAILRHKPSICSVNSELFESNCNLQVTESDDRYVQEPVTPVSEKKSKRVGFQIPSEDMEDVSDQTNSMDMEFKRQSPVSAEGRHGLVANNQRRLSQTEMDQSQYYDRRVSDDFNETPYALNARSCEQYQSEYRARDEPVEDKTIPFVQQYCSGETKYELPKIEETKPAPLPQSYAMNRVPQQWQSQMLRALIVTPKECGDELQDPFEKARQEAFEQQIEDDKKARDAERRKLMDEMIAKQRAMRQRQEQNEIDQAKRFGPVSKLAPRTPDDWKPQPATPTVPLPEETKAYIPDWTPSMEPIKYEPISLPRTESPMLQALKTAPVRPYTPFSGEVMSQLYDMPVPQETMTFSSALVTAPDRPFTPYNELTEYDINVPVDSTKYEPLPSKIYDENQKRIRRLEEKIDKQHERQGSAFANFHSVKPSTPVPMRQELPKPYSPYPFANEELEVEPNPVPIVCVPQECLQTYQSMCSMQQRTYHSSDKTQQVDRKNVRHAPLPPRTPSPRKVEGQRQVSPALLKPDPAGLHKAERIPQYQRKWFNLPTQRASITPEPHELRENVPLAFIAAPKQPSPTISKPIAISAANTYTTSFSTSTCNYQTTNNYNYCTSERPSMQQNGFNHQYPTPDRQSSSNRFIEPRHSITSQDTRLPFNQNYSQKPLLAIEPRYSIAESSQEEPVEERRPSVTEDSIPEPYESGNPTQMLEQSVRDLKISNTQNPIFKAEASHVLTAMLENRLKKQANDTNNNTNISRNKHMPVATTGVNLINTVTIDVAPPLPKSLPPIIDTCDSNQKLSVTKSNDEILPIRANEFCNNKPMHALNRLSYIEKSEQINPDLVNECHNNFVNEEDVNRIATDLQDGEHPVCCRCNKKIMRGPFITALGRIWCPEHFICVNANCKRPLADIGFVEEKGDLYCEYCFEQYLAPPCSKCAKKVKGDCVNAIGKQFHPECFTCSYCGRQFGNQSFFLEEGEPYCENDWNELFTTKCISCGFPIEAGDKWVEALNNNYHSQCFNCTMCKRNLEGQSFYAKGGRPFCKNHAR